MGTSGIKSKYHQPPWETTAAAITQQRIPTATNRSRIITKTHASDAVRRMGRVIALACASVRE
jgi:hypothetical protein